MTSIRESSFIDIAGFPGTTRVFKTQAPPGAPQRRTAPGAAVVSSVVGPLQPVPGPGTPPLRMRYTAANLLVMSLEPAGASALPAIQPGRQRFVADRGGRAA